MRYIVKGTVYNDGCGADRYEYTIDADTFGDAACAWIFLDRRQNKTGMYRVVYIDEHLKEINRCIWVACSAYDYRYTITMAGNPRQDKAIGRIWIKDERDDEEI